MLNWMEYAQPVTLTQSPESGGFGSVLVSIVVDYGDLCHLDPEGWGGEMICV